MSRGRARVGQRIAQALRDNGGAVVLAALAAPALVVSGVGVVAATVGGVAIGAGAWIATRRDRRAASQHAELDRMAREWQARARPDEDPPLELIEAAHAVALAEGRRVALSALGLDDRARLLVARGVRARRSLRSTAPLSPSWLARRAHALAGTTPAADDAVPDILQVHDGREQAAARAWMEQWATETFAPRGAPRPVRSVRASSDAATAIIPPAPMPDGVAGMTVPIEDAPAAQVGADVTEELHFGDAELVARARELLAAGPISRTRLRRELGIGHDRLLRVLAALEVGG